MTDKNKVGYRAEYFLDKASVSSVWNQISTSRGLSEWFAPKVDITGTSIHVFWDDVGDDREATIIERTPEKYIKWTWDDDPDSYVSMEIVQTELSRSISLIIDDHDKGLRRETLEGLWENHLERLLMSLGLS